MNKIFEPIENHQPRANVIAGNWDGAADIPQTDREHLQLLRRKCAALEDRIKELESELRDWQTGWV